MFVVPITRRRADPARSFDQLFDDSFDRFFASAARSDASLRSPALDVAESDRAYSVTLDLPGVAKEDVKIAIDGRHITIEAQTRKEDAAKDGERIVYRERSVSSFARSFTVASDVDQAQSAAKLEHGVLTLTLIKRSATSAAQITVN